MESFHERRQLARWLAARVVLLLACWIISFPLVGVGLSLLDLEGEPIGSIAILVTALGLFGIGVWKIRLPEPRRKKSQSADEGL